MRSIPRHPTYAWVVLVLATLCANAQRAGAVEAGQGTFDSLLGDDFRCSEGGGSYTAKFRFDDKTFTIPLSKNHDGKVDPGDKLEINFSVLGEFLGTGDIQCVPDEGGTFTKTAVNEAGDFQWIEINGEYMDHKPGISEGDPFQFVATARCSTTRQDDFLTLCENFEFSANGLAKALAPDETGFFRFYSGDFTMRAVQKVKVDPSPEPTVKPTPGKGGDDDDGHHVPVDNPDGDVPEVEVTFENGIAAAGELHVTTLGDAHGTIPAGMELPVRGTTAIDHGAGPVPFFQGGDERFVEVTTDAVLPSSPSIEVCLPMPKITDASEVRPVRVLHGEGSSPMNRAFVDRTSRTDPTTGKACAKVSGFSKFAVATTDVCGGGQMRSDGLITVAGGLLGKKTVVVDGLADCTQFPANLPQGLRRHCVPDADTTVGQCTVSVTLGINRGGCNRVPSGTDPHSPSVDTGSYAGRLTQGRHAIDLAPIFGPLIAALSGPVDATVGPVDLALPASRRITTYKLKQKLRGIRPGTTGKRATDKDTLTIQCVDPTRF